MLPVSALLRVAGEVGQVCVSGFFKFSLSLQCRITIIVSSYLCFSRLTLSSIGCEHLMFLLNNFVSNSGVHLLILQLIITLLLLLELVSDFTTAINMYTKMAVTTRSQTKTLKGSL